MHLGFIGTGSMGKILIDAFISSKAILPTQVHASNRTFAKVKELAKIHTGLRAYPTNVRVVERADIIFLCVKPLEYKQALLEIAPYLRPEQLLIFITSPVQIKQVEGVVPAKIAKVIPSITNAAASGASLLIAGNRLSTSDREQLFLLMSKISLPLWIDEQYTRISSDIVSCGPAFISYLLQEFIAAAVQKTGLPKEQATSLTTSMMIGFGQLLASQTFTLESLQERVCVPGGITGVGLQVLENELNELFVHLFEQTHHKFAEDLSLVEKMFKDYHQEQMDT